VGQQIFPVTGYSVMVQGAALDESKEFADIPGVFGNGTGFHVTAFQIGPECFQGSFYVFLSHGLVLLFVCCGDESTVPSGCAVLHVSAALPVSAYAAYFRCTARFCLRCSFLLHCPFLPALLISAALPVSACAAYFRRTARFCLRSVSILLYYTGYLAKCLAKGSKQGFLQKIFVTFLKSANSSIFHGAYFRGPRVCLKIAFR